MAITTEDEEQEAEAEIRQLLNRALNVTHDLREYEDQMGRWRAKHYLLVAEQDIKAAINETHRVGKT